jgi:hypothetical protein
MALQGLRLFLVLLGASILSICSFVYAQSDDSNSKALQLEDREKFDLALPKISVSADVETQDFNGVKILFPESNDQVIIGMGDDMYIKNTSHGAEKTLYREPTEKAGFVSKFEAKTLSKVNKEFADALEQFDKILQKNNWGRCLYLDAFLPHFLNGYYFLICAIRNSTTALSRGARIPENEYDVSLYSEKTDARIRQWRSTQDNIIKLRIASKELNHQLKVWQKSLDKVNDNEDIAASRELEEAFIVFVRVYFNLKPPSPIVFKKQR